jgi:hypothetical protein
MPNVNQPQIMQVSEKEKESDLDKANKVASLIQTAYSIKNNLKPASTTSPTGQSPDVMKATNRRIMVGDA